MITELSQDELVEMGSGLRAAYLSEQAGYTLELAAGEGQALADLLPEGFLKEVAAAQDSVASALQDRVLMEDDSGSAGEAHRKAYRDAKIWRRKIIARATSAERAGRSIPDILLHVHGVKNGPPLLQQISEMTKVFEANMALLDGKGKEELLAQGRALCDAMAGAGANHEVKRLKELPDAVRAFRLQKGLLYVGLKRIHDAGRELHAGDSAASGRYNLAILHRHAAKRSNGEAPQAPAGAPKA
ncbi:MAG: hypothetical protein WBS54_04865 [Acidobacteriota bacterium]